MFLRSLAKDLLVPVLGVAMLAALMMTDPLEREASTRKPKRNGNWVPRKPCCSGCRLRCLDSLGLVRSLTLVQAGGMEMLSLLWSTASDQVIALNLMLNISSDSN